MVHTLNCDSPNLLNRSIASITPGNARSIPEIVLKGIMAVAAVHLSLKNPGIAKFHRLALEAKAVAYECFNTALQNFAKSPCDRAYCCLVLIFSLDVSLSPQSRNSSLSFLISPVKHFAYAAGR